ncbi:hypothetical protein acdb102_22450 [Acidothermaceae bacterium B102]|nr:hypothetical protein acdb102_22450 [Acidothermaceae bacterium B102]
MPYALGIDLGTTFTAAAAWENGLAEVVPIGADRVLPSVVLMDDQGRFLAGEVAESRAKSAPDSVAREFKRRFGDEVPLLLSGTSVTPELLTTELLRWVLAEVIVHRGGERPVTVALTVPATWQGYRRGMMQTVARQTGLGKLQTSFIPEPAAAAVFYAGSTLVAAGSTVGVYDFGGGTFDATVVRKTSGGFEILGLPMGIDDIGGVDIDHALQRLVSRRLGEGWSQLDMTDPPTRAAMLILRAQLVEAKKDLSLLPDVAIPVRLPGLVANVALTRRELEDEVRPMVLRTIELMRSVITQAGLTPGDLERVLLVGGSSQMPLVATLLREELGVTAVADTHPKYAVCLGAAIAAGALLAELPPAPQPLISVPAQPQPPDESTQPPPPPGTNSETSIVVNLYEKGLTEAALVPVRPAADLRRRPAAPMNETLVATLGDDDGTARNRSQVAIVLVTLAALAVVLLLFLLA